jgi:hypothetical protein
MPFYIENHERWFREVLSLWHLNYQENCLQQQNTSGLRRATRNQHTIIYHVQSLGPIFYSMTVHFLFMCSSRPPHSSYTGRVFHDILRAAGDIDR